MQTGRSASGLFNTISNFPAFKGNKPGKMRGLGTVISVLRMDLAQLNLFSTNSVFVRCLCHVIAHKCEKIVSKNPYNLRSISVS